MAIHKHKSSRPLLWAICLLFISPIASATELEIESKDSINANNWKLKSKRIVSLNQINENDQISENVFTKKDSLRFILAIKHKKIEKLKREAIKWYVRGACLTITYFFTSMVALTQNEDMCLIKKECQSETYSHCFREPPRLIATNRALWSISFVALLGGVATTIMGYIKEKSKE